MGRDGTTLTKRSSARSSVGRILAPLLACALVAGALGTACASAAAHEAIHRFTGTRTQVVHIAAAGEQEFDLSPFMVTCQKVKSSKTSPVVFPAPTIYLQLNFADCSTNALAIGRTKLPAGKAVFATSVDIELHASGYAEIGAGSRSDSELKEPKPIQIAPGDGSECVLALPPQTVPAGESKNPFGDYEAVLYEALEEKVEKSRAFPTGTHDKLLLKSVFAKLTYSLTDGDCSGLSRGEHKGAEYAGVLRAELPSAELGWE
jgi:uncharacterized cupredoxin-like copper-binding protein